MATIFSRIIHYGIKNFVRNGLLSTATVAIMTLSLVVFTGLIFTNVITKNIIGYVQDKIDISVYFKNTTSEDQILGIQSSLKNLPDVKNVEYISSDQALVDFKAQHANDQTIAQSIDELGANPLEASLNVKAYSPDKYATIAKYLSDPSLSQYIDTVSYYKNQVAIDNLTAIVNGANRLGIVLRLLLTLIAGLVVFNTIRLVIYSNRDEIIIMRSVGASNLLVRGPYVVEGIITGAISAVLSVVILFAFVLSFPFLYGGQLASYFALSYSGGFNVSQYFYTHIVTFLLYGLVFGILVATFSSFIAARRYLKN